MTDPTTCNKDWIDILSALLTPTFVILGSWIAYRQWRINRDRLKHELFDRRWDQFVAIKEFMSSIIVEGKVLREARINFQQKTRGCRFLFNVRIDDYVSDLYKKSLDLGTLDSELQGLTGADHSDNIKKQREIKEWFESHLKYIEDLFEPYLKLKH